LGGGGENSYSINEYDLPIEDNLLKDDLPIEYDLLIKDDLSINDDLFINNIANNNKLGEIINSIFDNLSSFYGVLYLPTIMNISSVICMMIILYKLSRGNQILFLLFFFYIFLLLVLVLMECIIEINSLKKTYLMGNVVHFLIKRMF
jgi:hypothetical protein